MDGERGDVIVEREETEGVLLVVDFLSSFSRLVVDWVLTWRVFFDCLVDLTDCWRLACLTDCCFRGVGNCPARVPC